MNTPLVIAFVVVLLVIAFAWWYTQRQRTMQLRTHFGPEYDRLSRTAGRHGAETELLERTHRVRELALRPLPEDARMRYADRWRVVQGRFVDDPGAAVLAADALVEEVMRDRGYPVGDFERQAADVSVDHPRVVSEYRAAHDIADRHRSGRAQTEDLRAALIHYRTLFDDLLDAPVTRKERR
jgi:hypothetical protein